MRRAPAPASRQHPKPPAPIHRPEPQSRRRLLQSRGQGAPPLPKGSSGAQPGSQFDQGTGNLEGFHRGTFANTKRNKPCNWPRRLRLVGLSRSVRHVEAWSAPFSAAALKRRGERRETGPARPGDHSVICRVPWPQPPLLACVSPSRLSGHRLKLAPRCIGGYSRKVWISLPITCWTNTKRQNWNLNQSKYCCALLSSHCRASPCARTDRGAGW